MKTPRERDKIYLLVLEGTARSVAHDLQLDFSEKSILGVGPLAHLVMTAATSSQLDL